MVKPIDRLSDIDYQIFALAAKDVNVFTDWYFRAPDSGTKYSKDNPDSRYVSIWRELHDRWKDDPLTSKKDKWIFQNVKYNVIYDGNGWPIFWHHHGFIFQDWQKKAFHAPQPEQTIIGGFGCSSYDSLVYNCDTQSYQSIGYLADHNIQPTVLAQTSTGLIKIKASIPFKKGRGMLYRVTMEDGQSIEVTNQHRFLSSYGYVRLQQLRPGDTLLEYDSTLLASNLELFPLVRDEDAQSCFETTLSSLFDCRHSPHLCGGLPLRGEEISVDVLPLLTDVHEHTHPNWSTDGSLSSVEYNRQDQQVGLLSNHGVYPLVERLAWQEEGYYVTSFVGEVVRLEQEELARLQSQGKSYPDRLTHESGPNMGQELIVSSLVQSPYLSIITQIEALGVGDYYDLYVPLYNNYLAEGLINHNSGKTAYIAISLAVMAALFPGFRGFAVAPQMIQASEVYKFLDRVTYNTPWFNRWVHRSTEHQKPGFTLQNDFIGKSEITILSIEDDPEKVRTVEGDVVFLDQAEKIQQLDGVIRDLGTRTRGMVNGRPRIGRLALIANSDNNPELWYRYDLGLLQPDNYLSLTVKSKDNHALSPTDIASFKRRVGGNAVSEAQWMDGERPIGSGEHFNAEMITRCTDRGLNATMDSIIDQRQTLKTGDRALEWMSKFKKEEAARCGIYHWEMPPDVFNNYKAQYVVIADPGSGDPPFRNSACIMVWDITHFPQKPAVMRAFHWVHGGGEYSPFINEFKRMVEIYHAQGSCAFDSTGIQKSFNELVFENESLSNDDKLMAEGMDMNGPNGKYTSLNALKLFMSRGMIKFPYLGAINLQLSNYALPDGDIPQDIVMTMAMSAQYIRQYYYHEKEDDDIVKNQLHKLAPNSYRINRSPRRAVDRFSKI